MARTVYAVSSGEWSDYSVHCLFVAKQDADAYCNTIASKRTYAYPSLFVEEFELFDEGEPVTVTKFELFDEGEPVTVTNDE